MANKPSAEQIAKWKAKVSDPNTDPQDKETFTLLLRKFGEDVEEVVEKVGEEVVGKQEPRRATKKGRSRGLKIVKFKKDNIDDIEKAKAEIKKRTGKTEEECESIIEEYRALRTKSQERKAKEEKASEDNKKRVEKLEKKGDIIEGTTEKTADAVIETAKEEVVEKIEKEIEKVEEKAEVEAKKEVEKEMPKKSATEKKEAVKEKVEKKVKEKTKVVVKRVIVDTTAMIESIANKLAEFDKDSQKEFLIKLRSDIDKLLSKYSFGGLTDGATQVMNVQQSNMSSSSVNPYQFAKGGGVGNEWKYNVKGWRKSQKKWVNINKNPMSYEEAHEMYDNARKSGLYEEVRVVSSMYAKGGVIKVGDKIKLTLKGLQQFNRDRSINDFSNKFSRKLGKFYDENKVGQVEYVFDSGSMNVLFDDTTYHIYSYMVEKVYDEGGGVGENVKLYDVIAYKNASDYDNQKNGFVVADSYIRKVDAEDTLMKWRKTYPYIEIKEYMGKDPYKKYAKGGGVGDELMGGQPNSEPKPSGYFLVAKKRNSIIVESEESWRNEGSYELWVKNNGYSGYTLRYNGNQYEFAHDIENDEIQDFFAHGGMTEHGLEIGDTIMGESKELNAVFVKNKDEWHNVFLDKGKRYGRGGRMSRQSSNIDMAIFNRREGGLK